MAFVLNVLPDTDDADTQVVTEPAEVATALGDSRQQKPAKETIHKRCKT